jgi:hypothetical protein
MKIDKVIFTCDDNPAYAGFWASISKHFECKLGMKSHLFLIGDDPSKKGMYSIDHGEVTFVPRLEGIPSIIQALWGKFYFTKTEPETVWMIGDLDLYPLQNQWFTKNIEDYSDDSYLHLHGTGNGKEWWKDPRGLAGFYHVAKGKVFEEYLELRPKFEDDCRYIHESGKYGLDPSNPAHKWAHEASPHWRYFCCEEQYTGEVLAKKKDKITCIPWPTEDFNSMRICRSTGMVHNPFLLEKGWYIDFHAPRPYEKYKDQIESIISKVPDINV